MYVAHVGHCKKLQPVWDELATELKGKVNVGKVDVTENRPLGSRFDIKGFPTIKFFHGGEIFPYKWVIWIDRDGDQLRSCQKVLLYAYIIYVHG